jgi:nucleoside 2-deoxyribosyltransferase
MSEQLRCFIAMAFDREDTDKIYDRAMQPCLKSLSIKPIRIDREEHNDDIDDKIIEELEKASFVIADLTYARPSVYFEAGYAERNVPVIYTCRNDHFRPKPDDEHGIFRVHFDLQMKNIIGWKDNGENAFSKRLSKRIKKVIAPILRQQQASQSEAEELRKFRALPLTQQRNLIRDILRSEIKAAGYTVSKADKDVPRTTEADWVGLISSKGQFRFVAAYVIADTSRNTLSRIADWSGVRPLLESEELRSAFARGRMSSIAEDILICTTDKIPHPRASAAFSRFSFDDKQRCFEGNMTLPYGLLNRGLTSVRDLSNVADFSARLHIIDGINSEQALRKKLRQKFESIRAKPSHTVLLAG